MEQLDLFATTTSTTTKKVTRKRKRKVKVTTTTTTTHHINQRIVDEESKIKELLSQPKQFDALSGAISWFKSKQYTWYCNTVERPERALRGLQSHLNVSDDKFYKMLLNDKVMVGLAKGTYLIYFKK
ncbi:hypothetical protein HOU40_gp091 [Lactobacillus phage Bromius]|uniref:Uncharacterized protein n=1 Tax=Lactobacillus phage Bromius TaxID=2315485 RepID=A0A3Q8HXV9_9CAUD|nr:hypothetical protein HOU40_gp091 [Lactobacillus phage Bromius]AYH92327.1 hypothetical protein [Lactobacillus phage Bromius]